MYHQYFGLNDEPFSIAVNPRYLFMSARHRDALAHLLYGVGVGGGFILLTGEVGTGKTTVNRCLLEQIPDNTDIALILNPALNAIELLATVCDELNIDYPLGEQSLKVLTDKLHQFLLANHAKGRNTVLLIDEAQHLQFDVLEQIRLLTNLETNTKKLLQIILVGQPELRALLNKPELRQLAQRITARYQLKPLSLDETQAYIRHRLQVAGLPANQLLFPASVVKGLHKASRGIPRIINVLCDRMLLGCYGQNKTTVDRRMLKQAIVEVMGEDEVILYKNYHYGLYFTSALSLLAITFLLWSQWPTNTVITPKAPVSTIIETKPTAVEPTIIANISDSAGINNPPAIHSFYFSEQRLALHELLQAQDFSPQLADTLCSGPKLTSPRCEQLQLASWQALLDYNRPALLTLITPDKIQHYVALVAIENDQARLSHNKLLLDVPLARLGQLWTGEVHFIWRPSILYTGPFSNNHQGPVVTWLAQRFAKLDGQQKLLAEQVFNQALTQRVKIFQQQHQLTADGVVGLKTLLKLNEQLDIGNTLQTNNEGA